MTDELPERLKRETKKWLEKVREERRKISTGKDGQEILDNIDAYTKDCHHFLEKNMPVEAFEAVIYAYGMLDALKKLERKDVS